MKYTIETGYPKNSTWFSHSVFKPGWYGSYPYFDMSVPSVDGIKTQHVELRIRNADDNSINGNVIGKAHIPGHGVLVEKGRLKDLAHKLEKGEYIDAIADELKQIANVKFIYANAATRKHKKW